MSWEAATVRVWSRNGNRQPPGAVVGLNFLLIIIIKIDFFLLFIIVTKLLFVYNS